ncbi:MAG: prepilin-type N-terminal cleavage/methylation domain-containing protein [Terriglobales bacterium]|jgi:prepilin-type N-terminal cleavage/methylation domain-containing protein
MRRQTGFTLIELLIVVAIILIIAAIAIPNMLRSRISANEASAVGAMRTYNTAQATYTTTFPTVGYATTFTALGPPAGSMATSAGAGLVDNVLGCAGGLTCVKSGYTFTLNATTATYNITAQPQVPGSSGQRYFYTDDSGVIRYNTTSTATGNDSPL